MMGGKGSGGWRKYVPCEGSQTVPAVMFKHYSRGGHILGECGVCGRRVYLTAKWNVPIHRALHPLVREWEGPGVEPDPDEGPHGLPEDTGGL